MLGGSGRIRYGYLPCLVVRLVVLELLTAQNQPIVIGHGIKPSVQETSWTNRWQKKNTNNNSQMGYSYTNNNIVRGSFSKVRAVLNLGLFLGCFAIEANWGNCIVINGSGNRPSNLIMTLNLFSACWLYQLSTPTVRNHSRRSPTSKPLTSLCPGK